jgi:hypothetical protein
MITINLEAETAGSRRAWWPLVIVFLALYGPFLLGWCPSGGDLVNAYLPYQQLVREAVHAGELPLYNAMTFCGRPLMSDIQVGVLYPPNWLHWVLPLPLSFALVVALHGALLLWGCWRLGRALDFAPAAIVLAATLYAASPFFLLKNNNGVVLFLYAGAWWPWLAWGFVRRRWLLLPWLFALSLLAGAPQITYYGWLAVLLLAGVWPAATARERVRDGLLLGLTLLAGLGLSAFQTAQTFHFVQHSFERGGGGAGWEYITDGSFAPRLFWLLVNPALLGDYMQQDELYWGKPPDFAEGCYYLPLWALTLLIPLALALAPWRAGGDLAARRRRALTLLALVGLVLAPLLALGQYSPLFKAAYAFMPGFNRFRVPARLMSLEIAAAALLAALALDGLLRGGAAARRKIAGLALGAGLLITLGLLAVTQWDRMALWAQLGNPLLKHDARLAPYLAQAQRQTTMHNIVGLSAALLMVVVLALQFGRPRKGLALLPALLALAELCWLTRGYQTRTPFAQFSGANYPATPLTLLLKQESHGGRVLWLDDVISWDVDQNQPEISANRLVMQGLANARGYDPLNARWLGLWMNLLAGLKPDDNPRGFMFVPEIARPAWLTLMGVELVVSYLDLTHVPGLKPLAQLPFPEGKLTVYRNERYRGYAFAAPMPRVAPNDQAALFAAAKMADDAALDPLAAIVTTQEALMPELAGTHAIDARFKIEPLHVGNHVFRYRTDFPQAALFCFAQSAWPGWLAELDGNPIPWGALNGTFLATGVPAGQHEVTFTFHPEGYAVGKLLSLLTLAALAYMTLRGWLQRRRQAL